MGPVSTADDLFVTENGAPAIWSLASKALRIKSSAGLPSEDIPLQNVLWVTYNADYNILEVSALVHKAKKLELVFHSASPAPEAAGLAATWAENVLNGAYKGIQRRRKLMVFVNPVGGPGKAIPIFERIVKPILEAARCELDVTITERYQHAFDAVQKMSLTYDGIVVLSGDGLIHEVLNGLGQRQDALTALAMPVAQIPTGSANALSINILGLKDAFDVVVACLNVIKGELMNLDLGYMTQGDKRIYSFLTQALGLMADLDLGTEHLRWMGDTRFVYGYLRGVVALKKCPIKLSMKIAEQDKQKMADDVRVARATGLALVRTNELASVRSHQTLEAQDHSGQEGWTTFEQPMLYAYGGLMPFVSRDLLQFPVCLPSDGLLDLVVQEVDRRGSLFSAAAGGGGPQGEPYWIATQKYFKVHAYRVEPMEKKGYLSIDGEAYPFEPFEVSVLPGAARTFSMHGTFVVNF